jgi:hypothetical protein
MEIEGVIKWVNENGSWKLCIGEASITTVLTALEGKMVRIKVEVVESKE